MSRQADMGGRLSGGTLHTVPSTPHVLRLEGELDAYVAPLVRERLQQAIDQASDGAAAGGVLLVDMEGVTFMDSTILGTLVSGLRSMRERGGELQLVYPAPPASRIFELTGLDAVFPAAPPERLG